MDTVIRCALVTGAARRVGAAIAETLHGAGYNVIVHYRGSAEEAAALCRRLNAARPDSAHAVAADLTQVEGLEALVEQAAQHWGNLDLLVNNASVFHSTPFGHIAPAQWDELLEANLKAPFFLCQAAQPWLRQRGGSIVNIADIHAERGLPGYPAYSISKAGVVAMTRALAKEMAPEVRVNAVAPGAILWPERSMDEAEKAQILARVPLQRLGSPLHIAKAVLFLARDADYVTGQVLAVDGGRSVFN